MTTTLHLAGEAPRAVRIPEGTGDHGGADPLMLEDLFGDRAEDGFGRASDHRGGAWAILTGIAANASALSGMPADPAAMIPGDLLRAG